MELTCAVPGIDFQQAWEVPVFVTPDSSESPPPEIREELTDLIDEQDYAHTSKIHVTPTAGGLEVYAPPARAKGSAVGITLLTAIWIGAVAFMIPKEAPILFPIVFGLFALFMIWLVLYLWFGSVRTTIRKEAITHRRSILGLGGAKNLSCDDVVSVWVAIGMRSGDISYYRVMLHTSNKRNRTVAAHIRDKNEARWLRYMLAEYLGVPAEDAPRKSERLE